MNILGKKTDNREILTGHALRFENGDANHRRYIHNGTGHRNPVNRAERVERRGWFGQRYYETVPVVYYPITDNGKTNLDEIASRIGDSDRVSLVEMDDSMIRDSQVIENMDAMRRGVHEFDLTHDWNGEVFEPTPQRGFWSWLFFGG